MGQPAEHMAEGPSPSNLAPQASSSRVEPASLARAHDQQPALTPVSGNAAANTAVSAAPTQQNAVAKPVFKMKRTGHGNLPSPATIITIRDGSFSSPATSPNPRSPAAEPDLPKIVSDILPPKPTPPPAMASNGARKTKFATDEERRKAISLSLKQRWASGRMDHVHKKGAETIRRKKEAAAAVGGVTTPSGPVGGIKHTPKSLASRDRVTKPGDSAASSSHHRRKRSLISSEKLAHLFGNKFSPMISNGSILENGANDTTQRSEATAPSTSSDEDSEMVDSKPVDVAARAASRNRDESIPESGWDEEDRVSTDGSSDDQEPQDSDGSDHEEEGKSGEPARPSIEMAASGRPYRKWRDSAGVLHTTYGALLPEGYEPSTTDTHNPWVCPIRTCDKAFPKLQQLGYHFVSGHRGILLHDNEDGTFYMRGVYAPRTGSYNRESSNQKQPAIVISQGELAEAANPSLLGIVPKGPEADDDDESSMSAFGSGWSSPTSIATPVLYHEPDEGGGDPDALWEYLQPFLIKHKGPNVPALGWVKRLLVLPKLRDLNWNRPWLATHPYLDSQPRDISALILQMTGDPAPSPCTRCRDGRGPFTSCIMISSKADSGPLETIFSCANCFYHYGQTNCSHRELGEARSKRIRNFRLGRYYGKETHLPNNGFEGDDAEISAAEEEDVEEVKDDLTPETSLDPAGETPLIDPASLPAAIDEAEPGRPYNMWPDDSGHLAPLFGGVLPFGYELDDTFPGRPWVCPLRTCRKTLCKRNDLGFHFERVHFASILNDNRDGTFSLKGVYKSKTACIGKGGKILVKAPSLVVSQEPVDTPVPPAQLPPYLIPRQPMGSFEEPEPKLLRARIADEKKEPRKTNHVVSGSNENVPRPEVLADLWAYIRPYLKFTTAIPENPSIRRLLALPKQRDIKFRRDLSRPFAEKESRDVAAIVLQAVGVEPDAPCYRCREDLGPFRKCVVVPEDAHPEVKERYSCCANCLYAGNKVHCPIYKASRHQLKFKRGKSAVARDPYEVMETDDDNEGQTTLKPAIGPRTVVLRAPRRPELASQPSFSSASSARQSRPSIPTAQGKARQAGPSALISQGTFQAQEDLLEMEDWEVAPGQICQASAAGGGAGSDNIIALSKPYLSSRSAGVPVADDVAFRVDSIPAGSTLRFNDNGNNNNHNRNHNGNGSNDNDIGNDNSNNVADDTGGQQQQQQQQTATTRLCSVAAGKVRVAMGDEPEFDVGPHGLFKVRAGVKCVVRNVLYLDAVLHTVVLVGYS